MDAIIEIIADMTARLCLMLGIGLDRSAIDEILEPLADDIQAAWVHWVAFP